MPKVLEIYLKLKKLAMSREQLKYNTQLVIFIRILNCYIFQYFFIGKRLE